MRRTESVAGVGDAGCQAIERPAANRCLLPVTQTAMSDPGGFAFGTARTGSSAAVVAECSADAAAPRAPNPNAVVLMKARLVFGRLVDVMQPFSYLPSHYLDAEGQHRQA